MSLIIQQQDSLFVESQSRNGVAQQVHYVVKNTPFHIKLSVTGSSVMNFNTSVLSCKLLYDLPETKEVEGVKGLPVDYLMHPSADGKQCSVQVRIRVLSTQHHGSHFIIRFRLVEKTAALEVNSQPIKTTSKLDPIRRKIAEQSNNKSSVLPAEKPKTKRARSDQLLESLEEIKETQREQNRMLSSLFFNLAACSNTPYPTAAIDPSKPAVTLETALEKLLHAYTSLDASERPYKLRHVVSSLPEYHQMISEVGTVLATPISPGYVTSSLPMDNSSPSLDSPSDNSPQADSRAAEIEDYSAGHNFSASVAAAAEDGDMNNSQQMMYLKELELWNSALHDLLTQEDI